MCAVFVSMIDLFQLLYSYYYFGFGFGFVLPRVSLFRNLSLCSKPSKPLLPNLNCYVSQFAYPRSESSDSQYVQRPNVSVTY